MKLPKEWEAIVGDVIGDVFGVNGQGAGDAIKVAVERCYALTQKPRKELTDSDCDKLCNDNFGHTFRHAVRAIEAAVWAKQREPETVTFRAARHPNGEIEVFHAEMKNIAPFEWLDLDGKPQTFEVKLPC